MISGIRMYIETAKKTKILSKELEQILFKRYADGDKKAREDIINSNLRLVISIASHYQTQSMMTLEDMIQEGNLGLISAVEKFDYTKGYKFSTYATYWIKQSISKAIGEKIDAIRTPANIRALTTKMKKLIQDAEVLGKPIPSDEELAKSLGIKVKEVKRLKDIKKDIISMSATVGNDEDGSSFEEIIEDTHNTIEDIDNNIDRAIVNSAIAEVLETLTDREKDVIVLRYGLDGRGARTLEQAGKVFDLTKERVRQIEEKALRKLRHPLRADLLKKFLS